MRGEGEGGGGEINQVYLKNSFLLFLVSIFLFPLPYLIPTLLFLFSFPPHLPLPQSLLLLIPLLLSLLLSLLLLLLLHPLAPCAGLQPSFCAKWRLHKPQNW